MNDSKKMNTYKWHELPWRKLEKSTFKLQKRIFQASLSDDVLKVRQLQRLLIKSWGAKCIAVRRISQDNQGKKTAGVDGIKNLSPKQRLALVDKISLSPKASPVRRVWIPKPGKKEKRPLGIPTMYERAVQSLVKMALEPEWEARFEPNSYGFRPGRSCHDAVEAIFKSIKLVPKYVLDADISQCFDRINHEKLLNKLNTFPTLRRQIRAWLKAGIWDEKAIFQSSEGTPQGGVISPLLANIALHGMEEAVKELAEISDIRKPDGQKMRKEDKRASLSLIRYADDFVILHKNYAVVKRCRELISQWLEEMGLELKPSKTRIDGSLDTPFKPVKLPANWSWQNDMLVTC